VTGGVVLVVVGLLMVTGVWEELNRWVQSRLSSSFQVVI
jgi:cytochrome c-type biogenesis protein